MKVIRFSTLCQLCDVAHACIAAVPFRYSIQFNFFTALSHAANLKVEDMSSLLLAKLQLITLGATIWSKVLRNKAIAQPCKG